MIRRRGNANMPYEVPVCAKFVYPFASRHFRRSTKFVGSSAPRNATPASIARIGRREGNAVTIDTRSTSSPGTPWNVERVLRASQRIVQGCHATAQDNFAGDDRVSSLRALSRRRPRIFALCALSA